MNYWMIASAALVLALVGACIACFRLYRQGRQRAAEAEQLRQEIESISRENVSLRREIAALCRDLEEEQAYSADLEDELDGQYALVAQAQQRAESAEARRTEAEKEIYAGRMRTEQLQQQLRQAHEEQTAQEQLYQDIIRDRDQTIARLQESHPKRRAKKKSDVIEHQITLDDIFNGGNE